MLLLPLLPFTLFPSPLLTPPSPEYEILVFAAKLFPLNECPHKSQGWTKYPISTNPSGQLQSATTPLDTHQGWPKETAVRGRWKLQLSVRTDNHIWKQINKTQSISILHWVSGHSLLVDQPHIRMTTLGLFFWGPGTNFWHSTLFAESPSYI